MKSSIVRAYYLFCDIEYLRSQMMGYNKLFPLFDVLSEGSRMTLP